MNFSENLRSLRKKNSVTQKDLAKVLGISAHGYQNYEYGVNEPTMSIMVKLADFYSITLDELTGRELPPTPSQTAKEDFPVNTGKITLDLDPELTAKAAELYKGLGVDLSTAIRVFFMKSLHEDGFPFRVNYETPNDDTITAIKNTLNGDNLSRGFSSVEELMKSLESDEEE